jgi:hypothetical protein
MNLLLTVIRRFFIKSAFVLHYAEDMRRSPAMMKMKELKLNKRALALFSLADGQLPIDREPPDRQFHSKFDTVDH